MYAVIMAGGVGSRFWPQSRQARPKQFLNVLDEASLLQNTVARLQGLVPPERCFVVTNTDYVEATQRQLPALPPENILAEPVGRNTAPCITYAALKLQSLDPDATMIVLPADHLIRDVAGFHEVLRTAVAKAETEQALVTIGIEPEYPATGYGYIHFDPSTADEDKTLQALAVKGFTEKPDPETAEQFMASGTYLWNSGMFIWQGRTILEEVRHHLPEVHNAFAPLLELFGGPGEAEGVRRAFEETPGISIDYGVMEQAEHVYVVPGDFGWSDVGDWRAVYDLSPKDAHGNAARGPALLQNAQNCLVETENRLVAIVGLENVAVIDTEDAILVCNLEATQQVKDVRNRLKEEAPEYT